MEYADQKSKKVCRKCVYYGGVGQYRTCDYILITGHRRPCEGGDECVKKGVFKPVSGVIRRIKADGSIHYSKVSEINAEKKTEKMAKAEPKAETKVKIKTAKEPCCSRCKKPLPAEWPIYLCPSCQAYMKQKNSEAYAHRKAQGLCVKCGKKAAPGHRMCQSCMDKDKIRAREKGKRDHTGKSEGKPHELEI